MPGYEWRTEPDGFTYLYVDYRDADEAQRYEVMRGSDAELTGRHDAFALVDVRGIEFDPMWFKGVKDASVVHALNGLRMAVLSSRKESSARVNAIGFIAGRDHTRPFGDETEALAWLRETARVRPGR